MNIELNGPKYKPQSDIIENICIFFHGWGSNGDDLIELSPILSKYFPRMLFLAPNAPEACEMNPVGRQWFNIMDREAGIDGPIGSIEDYIKKIKIAYNIKNEKIFLFGFSQGAMMALHYGLREVEKYAGILAFSGSLVSPSRLGEIKNKTPILLVHGKMDEVVPFDEMQKASEKLKEFDLNVETFTIQTLGHGIDNSGIEMAIKFMKKNYN